MLSTVIHDCDRSFEMLPDFAVYRPLVPVSAAVRGTSVSVLGMETKAVTGNSKKHIADTGAVAFIEGAWRGIAVGLLTDTNQPELGLRKRHGATRGRPPREHLRGLP